LRGTNGPDHLKPEGKQEFIYGFAGDDIVEVVGSGVYDAGQGADIYVIAANPKISESWIVFNRQEGDKVDLTQYNISNFSELMKLAHTVPARNDDDTVWEEHVEISGPDGLQFKIEGETTSKLRPNDFLFAKEVDRSSQLAADTSIIEASSAGTAPGDALSWAHSLDPFDDAALTLIGQVPPETLPFPS
jgi:hypothetical protein